MNPNDDPRKMRKGPDFWVKFVHASSIAAWGMMLVVLLLVEQAKPDVASFFSRLFSVSLKQSWNMELLSYAYYLSVFMFIFNVFALGVNKQRHKRKEDRYSKSIIIALLISLAVIFFYLTQAW